MSKRRLATLLLFISATIIAGLGVWFTFFRSRPAALSVESSPSSTVFVNGEQVGKTPYEGEFSEAEVTVKLVPESFEKPVVPYEVKVRLTSGVKTIVRREMGETEGESSGVIVSFEKFGGKEAGVAVVSEPDMSQVFLDNQFQDVTPIKLNGVSPEVHQVNISADGYITGEVSILPVVGYTLTIIVDLAKDKAYVPDESNQEVTEANGGQIIINETPVGFLRVREESSTESSEVAQVSPGSTYPLLDSIEGWYKIELEDGKSGWVSSEYATESAEVQH